LVLQQIATGLDLDFYFFIQIALHTVLIQSSYSTTVLAKIAFPALAQNMQEKRRAKSN